jgi:acetylglutamate kinase
VSVGVSTSVVVIKVGGAVAHLDGALGALPALLADPMNSARFVLVHGGGKDITHWMNIAGLPVRFKDGLRITTAETLEIATMVLRGSVNLSLVAALARDGVRAIGLSGADAALIEAIPHPDPEIGLVGHAGNVNAEFLHLLIGSGLVPVIAPLGLDAFGQVRNINADTVCGAVARALHAAMVIFLTDVPGVLDERGVVFQHLTTVDVEHLIASGTAHGGMVPKLRACVAALQSGARAVCIADGRDPAVLPSLLSGTGSNGTIVSDYSL